MRIFSAALIFALIPFALHADDAANTGTVTAHAQIAEAVKWEDATFLGLVTEPLALARAAELQLPAGTGLSVVAIAPSGPAAKAGIQAGDVLTTLDGQLLVNPAQLRVLVRMHKAGDKVSFQAVRNGKPQEIKAALGSHKMPPLTPGGEEPRMLLPDNAGQWKNGQGGPRITPFGKGMPPEVLQQLPPEMRAQVERAQAQVPADGAPGEVPNGLHFSSRSISNDGTHTIEIEHGAHEHMNITDRTGKNIYNGKIPTTDEEWNAVPEEARAKAKAMAKNQNIHVQFSDKPAPADADNKQTDDKPGDAKPGQSF